MRILITGAYGFIGYSVAVRLLNEGHEVIGVDRVKGALSEKTARIRHLKSFPSFAFVEANLAEFDQVKPLFADTVDHVLHFAGQYSVMHNTKNMLSYVDGNCRAFVNVIECARLAGVQRFIYASSTFVQDGAPPVSMYGATKRFNEDVANVYTASYGMETIGLRFAATYGPHLRPDTGPYILAKKLWAGEPIAIDGPGFGHRFGMVFINDAVECVLRFMAAPMPKPHVVAVLVADDVRADLFDVLCLLEKHSGRPAKCTGERINTGTPTAPTPQIDALRSLINYAPATKLDDGMRQFAEWFGETA